LTNPLWDYLPLPTVIDLLRRRPPALTLFYGYESHETIAWSRCAAAFIALAGCC
jgi:hypothetical protein